jgi:predicted O-methyltransferase YrrM
MRRLRQKINRALARMAARLDSVDRRDEDLALSHLLTPAMLSPLHDPVGFVAFVRACLRRLTCDVVKIKQPIGNPLGGNPRFSALLDALKDVPAIATPVAVALAGYWDRYGADRRSIGGSRWAADVGLAVRVSSCPPEKGRILGAIVRYMRSARGLELGTAYGMSAIYVLEAMPAKGELDTIELNEPQFSIASAALTARYPGRVRVHQGQSHEVIPAVGLKEQSVDFLFHDAHHSMEAYIRDFHAALPYLATGAAVLFDDIRWEDRRFTRGPARTYDGWRAVVAHPRVTHAVEINHGLGLALLA